MAPNGALNVTAVMTKNGVPSGELDLDDNVLSNICACLIGGHSVRGVGAVDAQFTLAWKVLAVSLETVVHQ